MYAATILAVLVGAIISTASAVVLESQESGWINERQSRNTQLWLVGDGGKRMNDRGTQLGLLYIRTLRKGKRTASDGITRQDSRRH